MMKRAFVLLAACVALATAAGPAMAGQYQDGQAAYRAGDYATALRDWWPLALRGDAKAQTNLGILYSMGEGVPQNDNRADKWWRLAFKHWRPLALRGDAEAQYRLGDFYELAMGVPQSNIKAARWWSLAAKHGNAVAQTRLGALYDNGMGVPKDYAKAAKWWRLAARQGYAQAQTNLGTLYVLGRGVPRDYVKAYMWFDLAAAGNPRSFLSDVAKKRDSLAALMTPAQIAEAQHRAEQFRPQPIKKDQQR